MTPRPRLATGSSVVALCLGVLLTGLSSAQTPAARGGDRFNVNTEDPECGGTHRRYHDQRHGVPGRVMPLAEMRRLQEERKSVQCSDCSRAGKDMVICWVTEAPTYQGRPPSDHAAPPRTPVPAPPSVLHAARAAADGIKAGRSAPDNLDPLRRAHRALPPQVPRPIDCLDMMVDAQSKRPFDPPYAIKRADEALQCYERRDRPADDCAPVPPPDVRQRLMDAAAEMDRAATQMQNAALAASEQFIQGMAEVLAGHLEFLAQAVTRPQETARQVGQAVIDYLTTDYNENNARLYDAAVEAVEAFRKNPARALGRQAGSTVAGAVGGGAVRACAAGTLKAVERAREIAAAQKAAQRLRKVKEKAAASIGMPAACAPIKRDCFWRTMRNATGDANFDQMLDGPGVSFERARQYLVRYFGHRVPRSAIDPIAHQLGIPESMSLDDIVKHLSQPHLRGAEGIVFVTYANGGGHAFNVKNFNGYVKFFDDQKQFWSGDAPTQTVEQALGSSVAWSGFYAVR